MTDPQGAPPHPPSAPDPNDMTVRQAEEQTRRRSWWVSGVVVLVILVVFVLMGFAAFSSN